MANAVIAEDERILRTELREKLAELWPKLTISAEAADGIAATRALDYVMKPISVARLAETVSRLKARLRAKPADLDGILKALESKLDGAREYLRWVTRRKVTTHS